MSLFGAAPPPGGPNQHVHSSLFGDGDIHNPAAMGADILRTSSQPVNVRSSGLFDNDGAGSSSGGLFDDADDIRDGDVWSILGPRSRSVGPGITSSTHSTNGGFGGVGGGSIKRGEGLVKLLITQENSNLPPAYTELYERVMADHPAGEGGFAGASGVSAAGVRKVLEDTGVDEDGEVGRRIKEVVVGSAAPGEGVVVGKGEFWVLLAMVGLAQEGEDVSIDGVDDRRRNLPIPKLKTYVVQQQQQQQQQQHEQQTPYSPIDQGGFESRDNEQPTPDTSAASSHHQHQDNSNLNQPSTTANLPAPTDRAYSSPVPNPPSSKTSPARIRTTNSYSRPALPDPAEQDPWGSPIMHTNHVHNSNNNPITTPPVATSNNYTIPQPGGQQPVVISGGFQHPPEDEHEPDDLQAALRAHSNAAAGMGGVRNSSSSAWGVYDGAAGSTGRGSTGVLSGYDGGGSSESVAGGGIRSPTTNRMGSFGGLGGGSLGGQRGGPGTRPGAGIGSGSRFEDTVTVTVLPEKEGMFLFQHRNYQISSGRRGSRVVRRYSDFVWLLDCLHKRYPFRCLPLLPPKRLAVNGHYLSADSSFLDNRRRGLVRFTNSLIRHPVLSQDQLVIMFLTVPTELSVWRKQASISVVDEFTTRLQNLNPQQIKEIENSLPPDLDQTFETVRSGLRKSAEIYIGLCTLVERLGRRQEGLAGEYARFAVALDSLTDVSEATYAVDTNDIPLLNDGLSSVARHLTTTQTLLIDEAKAWDEGLLEDLKRQRDGLVSMRELFDRKDRLLSNDPIPGLEKRIANNERKIEALREKPDGTPNRDTEIERLNESVKRDLAAIVEQKARRVLVKECLREELGVFHAGQYHVSRLHQDWSQERVKYAELQAENWRSLSSNVEGMPLGE